MIKKKAPMTFGVRINTHTGIYNVRCLLGEEAREPEAHEHLNRVGDLVKTFPTGFYQFVFTPKFAGLFWDYEWVAIDEPLEP